MAGPSIFISGSKVEFSKTKSSTANLVFSGETSKMNVRLSYYFENKAFAIQATVKNNTAVDILIDTLMLRVGLNTEMDSFPHWNKVYFPAMMRCENDFFWGYLMNPDGKILTVVSQNAVA